MARLQRLGKLLTILLLTIVLGFLISKTSVFGEPLNNVYQQFQGSTSSNTNNRVHNEKSEANIVLEQGRTLQKDISYVKQQLEDLHSNILASNSEQQEKLGNIKDVLGTLKQSGSDVFPIEGAVGSDYERENATFVSLVRNSELWAMVDSIRHVEDRFNRKFKYDWVFLNDEPFSDEFKTVTTSLISGTTRYGLIPKEHWGYPDFVDQALAAEKRQQMAAQGIIYADSESYRHMCRFESGFFWRHPIMNEYKYYWRVEPDIRIYCDINYDLFKYMRAENKTYGFTMAMYEYLATIESLWPTTMKFMEENPQFVADDNMAHFITDENGNYNLCHFWSNFEVADMDFWRGEAYTKYFDYLDSTGGFFYERWGDAPVHSLAAIFFLPRSKIHWFGDVGYYHNPYSSCPNTESVRIKNKCACNPHSDFTWQGYSCMSRFFESNKYPRPEGWEIIAAEQ